MTHPDKILGSLSFAGQVERFHTWPIGKQSNAAHMWRVATIAMEICFLAEQKQPSREILLHCLLHDVKEVWTGDNPHYAKRESPALKQALTEIENAHSLPFPEPKLSEFQLWIVKLCDLLECWEHASEAVAMGNRLATSVLHYMDEALGAHFEKRVDARCETYARAALDWINSREESLR